MHWTSASGRGSVRSSSLSRVRAITTLDRRVSSPSSTPDAASRRTLLALLSLVALALAGPAWAWTLDQPFLRSSGLAAWVMLALGLALALVAAWHDSRLWMRAIVWIQVAALLFAGWAAFVWARLPETHVPERAPDFTLPDQDGRPVTLSKELQKGPVLLVFFRGHW